MIDFLKNMTIRKFYLQKLWWDQDIGFLNKSGWLRSFREKKCVDADGKPVPWLTFSLNQLLIDRLKPSMLVYEFGSGYSTLFFADRVEWVDTVEYDREWYEWLKGKVPANVTVANHLSEDDLYVSSILDSDKTYDLIVIDGRRRNECVTSSLKKLSSAGVIIYDDTHREKYRSGALLIEQAGFKRLDFWGFINGSIELKCSTIFYRADNCMNI